MPIRQKQDQVNRAQEHIKDLEKKFPNVKGKTINLTPVFETFEDMVEDHIEGRWTNNLALANTRSRFRMVTLYYFGQLHGLLVCGTAIK
jgi:NAD+ synthase